MITLGSRRAEFRSCDAIIGKSILRVTANAARPLSLRRQEAFLVRGAEAPEGYGWYFILSGGVLPPNLSHMPHVLLGAEFDYLGDGDVVRLVPERKELRVIYRRSSPHNSFLLTERCNNYCLMCSQPPRNVEDSWIADEILEAIPLIHPDTTEIGFTGGEPTLLDDRFFELVQACKSYLPRTALHVLSNGRTFADNLFAERLGKISHPDLMIGIPIYSELSHVHDYVVQAEGAFDETLRGILNLKRHGVKVEIRVVLHKQTTRGLASLARFIARNLLFVDHVALMGLEMMGFTRANLDSLWIDPFDYQRELADATGILDRAGVRVSLYNSQLCLTDPDLWRFTTRSISDWKQEYMPECEGCSVQDQCAGFFASAKLRYSDHIRPITSPSGRVHEELPR